MELEPMVAGDRPLLGETAYVQLSSWWQASTPEWPHPHEQERPSDAGGGSTNTVSKNSYSTSTSGSPPVQEIQFSAAEQDTAFLLECMEEGSLGGGTTLAVTKQRDCCCWSWCPPYGKETVNQDITPENAWHQDDRHKVSEQVPSPDHTGLSPSEIWYANRIARCRRRRETLAAVVGVCLTTVVGARWYHHYGEDSTTTTTAQDNRPHSSHS